MDPITILPVILAGGSGTRLWPLSRELFPKQFLSLEDAGQGHSLLQKTLLRSAVLPGVLPPVILCGEDQRFLAAEHARLCGVADTVILVEPAGRNTAPAAACAAHWAANRYGADVILLLMAADHVIADQAAFSRACLDAAQAAASGVIVTFGIQPTRPETGYGYIKIAAPLSAHAYGLSAFVEKPDRVRAEGFLKEGGYYWNGGLFMFQASTFLSELGRLEPEMCQSARESVEKARGDLDFIRLEATSFKACRNESIDYAVMERTHKAAVVPMDAGWDDVGSWTFMDTLAKDDHGNFSQGDVWLEDAHDNLVHSGSRLVAVAGIRDTIVVETKDAVLVTSRERAQDVKKIVASLKKAGRVEAVSHPQVFRPWGSYETIDMADRYQVKHIIVKPGEKLSLQMHHHRAEHWIVVKGTAQVTCDDKVFMLSENQSCYIPLGARHRLENPGKLPLELIEVQSGSYLGEDDIVRFEDVYGRSPAAAAATPIPHGKRFIPQ